MKLINIYIIRQFVMTLVFALIALCVIFLVVNLMESLDDFLDQKATFGVIARYYLYFFPEILKLLTPVAVLLSTLFTIGRMSTQNEITAMKSGGLSLYGLMIPLVVLSLMLSLFQLYFNGWLVPKANTIKIAIEDKYLNKHVEGGPLYNMYFRDNPMRNIVLQYYDADTKSGTGISIEDYTSEKTPRLVSRTEANRFVWDSTKKNWELLKGIKRDYSGTVVRTTKFDALNMNLRMTHNDILQLKRSPDEMNFDEVRAYINILGKGGKDVRRQLIEYYGDYAFPFANFIVVLFGVPFASIKKKGGIAIQIGAAMIVSFLYLIFTKIGQTVGYNSNLDPVLSAWLANILFFFVGLVNLLRTKT